MDCLPEILMKQFRSSGTEKVRIDEEHRFKFLFDPARPSVSLYRLVEIEEKIKLTVTHLVPSVLDLYPSVDELDFEF